MMEATGRIDGAIEIAARDAFLFSSRWGSLIVAAWLAAIIVKLLIADPPKYHHVASETSASSSERSR